MMRVLSPTVLALSVMLGPLHAQGPQFETTQLADGVFQFRFQAHQGLFVVTDDGVIAIDPISPTAAEHFAAEIRRMAPGKSLRAIVYSHEHADHATGADVLRRALGSRAPIIAHTRAHSKIVARANREQPPPDMTFDERLTLHSGDRTLELYYLGKSHSDNMIVAYLPAERIAFAVDFVTNDGVGYRDLPDYHFPEFFETLRRLLGLDFETIAFGHGAPGNRSTIERQIRYYDELRLAVQQAIDRGLTEDQAAQRVTLPAYRDWRGYGDWFPLNVRALYRWMKSSEE